LDTIQRIQDTYDYVDETYYDRSPEFKQELTYELMNLDNVRDRIKKIKEKANVHRWNPITAFSNLINEEETPSNTVSLFGSKSEKISEVLSEQDANDLKKLERREKILSKLVNKHLKDPNSLV
jgi:adenine-specific DNA methylase